jgi:hypothetical protein
METIIPDEAQDGGGDGGGPCLVAGTRIATSEGAVSVENLSIGAMVLTASGESRPVRWLGHRELNCNRYKDPAVVWPICVKAGAFAENLPTRDLWVSPRHAIFVDGVLIQAELLVNGATLVQVPRGRVEYWHVELDNHDILLSEGLATESYLDNGNRTAFVNGGAYMEAYPDFKPKHWTDTCVPLVLEGPALHSAKAALLARAQALGYAMTEDAAVHLMADGERIEPLRLGLTRLAFVLPAARSTIELGSRSFVPANMEPASEDRRSLGICVRRLQVDGVDIALENDAAFAPGWHKLESNATGEPWRWSSGSAPLPPNARLVVIDYTSKGPYWLEQPSQLVAASA